MASIDDNESSSLQEMLSNEASILGSSVPELCSAKMRRFASPNLIWREKVTQWCYDVVDHLNESRDIVYVAMNLLDRYCTKRRTAVKRRQEPTSNIVPVAAVTSSRTNRQQEDDDDMDKPEYDVDMDEREYELAAMTAVFLAVRVSGSGNLEVPDLIRMSRGGIELRDVIATGKAMIELLSEQQCLCTPIQFLRAFLDLLLPVAASATSVPNDNATTRSKAALLDVASFLVEISVCDAFFIGIAPSKLAMAAVIHASSAASHASSSFTNGERHSFYTLLTEATGVPCNHADILVLRQRLHSLYCQSDESNRLSPHVVPDDDDEENVGEVATLATTNQASSPSDSTCNEQVSRADIPTVADSGRASITHRGKRAVSPERTTIPSDSSTTRCPSSKRYKHCV